MTNFPYSVAKFRAHSGCPEKSNAARSPVPNMTQTVLPSVTGDGEAMLLRPATRLPTATCFCQLIFPVCRSRQKSSRFSSSSGLVTKTESSQMIGVAWPVPGSGVDQRTFSVLLQVEGRLVSVVEPLRKGPRHCGQFSAETPRDKKQTKQPAKRRIISFIKKRRGID